MADLNNKKNEDGLVISERDRRAICLVSKLNDKELFGLECYLAGMRVAARELNVVVNQNSK
ncbi:MAG: hypothetical protein IJ958_03895 [Agathobacter sp.]|nr:hypothetical protein [Agathobacter sp.]